MTARPMRLLASEAARTVRRGLREARRLGAGQPIRSRGHVGAVSVQQPPAPEPEIEAVAGDAELDALRGALVQELDRLAAADQDCSATFRRA